MQEQRKHRRKQRKRRRSMRKKRLLVFGALICWLVAMSVILYPFVSNWLFEKNVDKDRETYESTMTEKDWDAELAAAKAYNAKISQEGIFIYDAFAMEDAGKENEYWELLKADEDGLMGYLSIPAISLNLPIYHGTSEETLRKGCGHLPGSSLPVGGDSTHAVLSAHTGMETAELFTNLDQLVVGNEFSISVFGQELNYEVDFIEVVLPEELDRLTIVENEDYITLVTCTPYGINSHRLLVRGSRK